MLQLNNEEKQGLIIILVPLIGTIIVLCVKGIIG